MEDYPRNVKEFDARFRSEEACREYLLELRWPDGFRCPRCGCRESSPVRTVLLRCRECRHQTSVTAGTIFQSIGKSKSRVSGVNYSFPSRMTQWCTNRSMAAAVVIGSLKVPSHFENGRLLVSSKSAPAPSPPFAVLQGPRQRAVLRLQPAGREGLTRA